MPRNRVFSNLSRIHSRIFFGWWIVVVGTLINAVGSGIFYHTFTVFFLSLNRELVLSSAAISLVFGASRLEGGIEGPLIGYLIHKLGPKKMIAFGSALAGAGFLILSRIHSFRMFFIVYVLVIALGANAGFYHPITTVINNWFIRRRGIVFGIITAAGSLGGMILVPLLSYFTLAYSWRTASVVSGCIILALCLPLACLMHRSPEEKGLEPDGGPGKVKNTEQNGPPEAIFDEVDFTVKQALKTFTFWLLTLCVSLRILVTVAMSAHMIPILVWKGMDEAAAAYMVSLYAFLTIIGMLVVGWIGDRFKKSMLCCVCLLITVVCLMWQTVSSTGATLYLLPVGMAIAMGSVPLNWSLIGDFFGRRSYAGLRGIMLISVGITTFISPVYAGWVFDRTQSYAGVLISFSGMLLIPAVLFAILRPPAPAKLENDDSSAL